MRNTCVGVVFFLCLWVYMLCNDCVSTYAFGARVVKVASDALWQGKVGLQHPLPSLLCIARGGTVGAQPVVGQVPPFTSWLGRVGLGLFDNHTLKAVIGKHGCLLVDPPVGHDTQLQLLVGVCLLCDGCAHVPSINPTPHT